MRAKLLIAALAGALGVFGGWLIGRQPAPPVAEVPKASEPAPTPKLTLAPPPRPARGERVIPLSEIVGTGSQPGMKDSLRWQQIGHEDRWKPLQKSLANSQTQHIFLVNALTVFSAADSAAYLLAGRGNADTVEFTADNADDNFWGFVSLGTWGDVPAKEIVSVTVSESSLEVRYKPRVSLTSSGAEYQHAFLIPIGKLSGPRWFALRLIDLDGNIETRAARVFLGTRTYGIEFNTDYQRLFSKP